MLAMGYSSRAVLVSVLCVAAVSAQPARPRARDIGLAPGVLTPGPLNAITDVAGVRVGHTTLVAGDHVRTGVTVVVPHAGNVFQEKVPGAVYVGNAFGKLAGSTQVDELGTIETPIALTNTLGVGATLEGIVRWTLDQPGNEQVRSVNALVGETNDGGLNDIRGLHVRPEHVISAIRSAGTGVVEEGSVGAGTGTRAFSWKGGIGTASRRLDARAGSYTVGVLVQTNYGGYLTMGGAPVGRELAQKRDRGAAGSDASHHDGSCMIVVATDAPLDARDLKRLAARAIFALARTGSSVQQWQRRLCDRVFHGGRPAGRIWRLRSAAENTAANRRGLDAVSCRARSDGGGGLQLTAEGHHRDQPQRPSRGYSDRWRNGAAPTLSRDP